MKRWGGYALEAAIGRGIEGTVYRARAEDGALVALKIPADNPATLLRLALEAANYRWLSSAHLMRFYGASLTGERCLAIALSQTGSLERVAAKGPLPDAAAIANAAMEAVLDLVELGAWYFDLRADNVVVADGEGALASRLRLIDLGAVTPVTPLLRFERWPYNALGALPKRGLGWMYAPLEGSDLFLPREVLRLHLEKGEPPFAVRALRRLISGEWTHPELGGEARACDEIIRQTGGTLCALAKRLQESGRRVLIVRLPEVAEGLPEIVPISVLEQLRVQSRFVADAALAQTFAPIAERLAAILAVSRWSPLLARRIGMMALPFLGPPLALDEQRARLNDVLHPLAQTTPLSIVLLREGAEPSPWAHASDGLVEWIDVPRAPLFPSAPVEVRFSRPRGACARAG